MKLNRLPNERETMKQERERADAIIALIVFVVFLVALKLLLAGFGV